MGVVKTASLHIFIREGFILSRSAIHLCVGVWREGALTSEALCGENKQEQR